MTREEINGMSIRQINAHFRAEDFGLYAAASMRPNVLSVVCVESAGKDLK